MDSSGLGTSQSSSSSDSVCGHQYSDWQRSSPKMDIPSNRRHLESEQPSRPHGQLNVSECEKSPKMKNSEDDSNVEIRVKSKLNEPSSRRMVRSMYGGLTSGAFNTGKNKQ